MAFLGQEEQLREFQDRFQYVYGGLTIALLIVVFRLVFLQIFSGDELRRRSEEQRLKRVTIQAPRGMIFDRNGTLLIDNQAAFDLEITPQYLKESKRKDEILEKLSKLVDIPIEQIKKKLKKARYQAAFVPVKIKTDLSRDEVAKIESWKIDMPGVSVAMEIKRTNVYGDTASHFLGYIGKINSTELPKLKKKDYRRGSSIGKIGIEKELEKTLRGQDGEELVEVDALGRKVREEQTMENVLGKAVGKPAIPGKNLILSVDQDLQLEAKKAFGDKVGSLVAMNPKTGEILAMISRPSFDSTEFSRGIPSKLWKKLLSNDAHPLRDKTIQDHYMPGSVFKALTAIAGLEEGVITKNTYFNCKGVHRVGRLPVHCWKRSGHGNLNVVSALEQSCDVFFYKMAQKLESVNLLHKWASYFGLGKKTGIMLPGEVPGLIPTEEWKKKRFGRIWTTGETTSVAIGQSFVLTTVLQLANVYSTLGNGGFLYKPFYLKKIETADGEELKTFDPELVRTIPVKKETLEIIKEGLYQVVNGKKGTAKFLKIPGADFAGKTGTAQVVRLSKDKLYGSCKNLPYKFRHHAVFAGFAPVKDPVIAVALVAEHECGGSTGAGPIARAVINAYLKKNYPSLLKQPKVIKPLAPIPISSGDEQ